ncbi:hypothetical protein ETU10_03310 [Apibacter muscae]|uniref:hypothetical protein n=1 Tax=Apibacter muscae TaxID=2509004 RepID=UPI0011ABB553|nr:hypothetical protein [Apibacter muscae]TWP24286.1 hypothetical protein ETU10_03310 [Apibacter muscae]
MSDFSKHEQLIDFLNKNYSNRKFKKFNEHNLSGDVDLLNIDDINNAVVIFTDVLNLYSGSVGKYDLYKLMQEYLTNVEKRDAINKIIKKL